MKTHERLINCGRVLSEKGLVWGHSGNISLKIESNAFLISAGGTDIGQLNEEDLILCRIDSDEFQGTKRPSMETGLHRSIYHVCENCKAIIHSQPFYTTMIACSDIEIRTDFLPEAMAYLTSVERVSYHHAGSHELAEAAANKTANNSVLLLDNHGAICWGNSLEEALLKTETLEFLCRLLVASNTSNIKFNFLGKEVMEDFHQHLRDIGRSS
ncbi:MAG: class II aldolase/adducin family protein [Chloroflexi bacterium]|nr:class II aldolase/adducin family protein [Chloroflexota bacterium]